jgi:hypothetical protein
MLTLNKGVKLIFILNAHTRCSNLLITLNLVI